MTSPLTDFSLLYPVVGASRTSESARLARHPDFRVLLTAILSDASGPKPALPLAAKAVVRQPGSGNGATTKPGGAAEPELQGTTVREARTHLPRAERPSPSQLGSETSSDATEETPSAPAGASQDSIHGDKSGFERSTDPRAPEVPRFKNVPNAAKYPSGPYQQAPQEYGGEWWLVNPFTGQEPWRRLDHLLSEGGEVEPSSLSDVEALPEGFVELFGPQPQRQDFTGSLDYRVAAIKWEQDLKHFRQVGTPEGIDEEKLNLSIQAFEEWGLGRPQFYEGRYGWRIRFPESHIPDFEMMPSTALQAPHIIIARYQIRLLREGASLDSPHPWIPPQLLASTES